MRARPPFLASSGGGTTSQSAPAIEPARGRRRAGAVLAALVALGSLYGYRWLDGLYQQFAFRRDLHRVRAALAEAAREHPPVVDEDLIGALRQLARDSGARLDERDVEIVARPVRTRHTGSGCAFVSIPELDRLNDADRRRFEYHPPRCAETRWILGFRVRVRTGSWPARSEFTVERYTWVAEYDPKYSDLVAIR